MVAVAAAAEAMVGVKVKDRDKAKDKDRVEAMGIANMAAMSRGPSRESIQDLLIGRPREQTTRRRFTGIRPRRRILR